MSPAVQEQRVLNVRLSSCFFLGGVLLDLVSSWLEIV